MGLVLGLTFFGFWATILFGNLRFLWHVVPKAFDRWASDQGYKIIRKRRTGPLRASWRHLTHNIAGSPQYDFTIEDREGCRRSGWAIVGSWWWPGTFSVERCPVQVFWDEVEPLAFRDAKPKVADDWSE